MRSPASLLRSLPIRGCFFLLALTGARGLAQPAAETPLDDVMVLPPFSVKGDRMEDLGLRFNGQFGIPTSNNVLSVAEVFPNTAASKAGLRPGDRVEKID